MNTRTVSSIRKVALCASILQMALANADVSDDHTLELVTGSRYGSSNFSPSEDETAASVRRLQRSAFGQANVGAFLRVGDVVYSVSYGADRVDTQNLVSNRHIGSWPVQPYAELALEPKLTAQYQKYDRPVEIEATNIPGIGCLAEHPLRYGDLDRDGTQELVLIIAHNGTTDWNVFSLRTHRVVFSARLWDPMALTGGEATPAALAEEFSQYGGPKDPQHPSSYSEFEREPPSLNPGVLSFAKLYFGDFDADKKFDILVWRKHYASREIRDPIKGFELKEQLLVHYEVDATGYYRRQSTEDAEIQAWLTQRKRSWADGYPNAGECAGAVGRPITDYHDPLLNDLDAVP